MTPHVDAPQHQRRIRNEACHAQLVQLACLGEIDSSAVISMLSLVTGSISFGGLSPTPSACTSSYHTLTAPKSPETNDQHVVHRQHINVQADVFACIVCHLCPLVTCIVCDATLMFDIEVCNSALVLNSLATAIRGYADRQDDQKKTVP